MDWKVLATKTGKILQKNSPYILVGVGIAGMGLAVASTIRATLRARDILDEQEVKLGRSLEKKEVIKATWTQYVPTVILFAGSTACIVGSSRIQFKRNAALGVAYKIAEDTARTMEQKLVEVVGEKKADKVRQEVNKEVLNRHPVTESTVVVVEKGKSLILDNVSGRYFESDIETVRKKVNDMNTRLLNEMYVSLNEVYYELGLPEVDVGDILGFNVDSGLIDPSFTADIADDGRPCLVLNWRIQPKYDYGRNM